MPPLVRGGPRSLVTGGDHLPRLCGFLSMSEHAILFGQGY
jgi:hypothetical protein